MKPSEINAILASINLPALSRDQLLALAKSNIGKTFVAALRHLGDDNGAAARTLSLAVRALSADTHSRLREMGFCCSETEMARLAIQEGEPLFSALRKSTAPAHDKHIAVAYLAGLGLARTPQPLATTAGPVTPPYYSFKVFSKSAALCISEANTRADNACTVQFEGAIALSAGGRSSYDWRSKIIVQLSTQEMYQVLALFEHKIMELKLDGHGAAHDKFLHFSVQDANYLVRMGQKNRGAVTVPVTAPDAIQIITLIYKRILKNDPHLDIAQLGQLLDRMANMMRNKVAAASRAA
jgi:hypothetical protein